MRRAVSSLGRDLYVICRIPSIMRRNDTNVPDQFRTRQLQIDILSNDVAIDRQTAAVDDACGVRRRGVPAAERNLTQNPRHNVGKNTTRNSEYQVSLTRLMHSISHLTRLCIHFDESRGPEA